MENKTITIESVVAENARRNESRCHGERYDPLLGVGCWGERVEACGQLVPRAVLARWPGYRNLPPKARERARLSEDFEYWCARCAVIKDKMSGRNVPFIPNRPQRRLIAAMERQRAAGQPVRVILLKARQWGGSTLVQMYLAWMQLVRHKGWNSLICGHLHATSKSLKRMYNLLLRHYPCEMLDPDDDAPRFTKLEGQPNVQQITARDCLVLTGSARSEDGARGYDIAMAHLSEVAYWKSSAMHNPDDLVRSVCGSVALKPETVIVLESTANGVGDYFHDEWQRAELGRSDKVAVFVPWHEIEIYRLDVEDPARLWQEMDEYERGLWDEGCTLEQINWYHHKRKEYRTHALMMAEYPGTPSEAFSTTSHCPFPRESLDALERGCHRAPLLVGDIQGAGQGGEAAKRDIHLVQASGGLLRVWEQPEAGARYLVVVDVGGKSEGSDYSVIAVWRWKSGDRPAAITAQWRGHIFHDQLAWKAMQLAKYYNNAVLVVECNTLINEAARAGESEYILQAVSKVYGNVYQREGRKLGFHTNARTKQQAIAQLIAQVRDGSYQERDIDAVNEMRDYVECNGRYGARPGKHDDILMTRAIGLHVMQESRLQSGDTPPDPHGTYGAMPSRQRHR